MPLQQREEEPVSEAPERVGDVQQYHTRLLEEGLRVQERCLQVVGRRRCARPFPSELGGRYHVFPRVEERRLNMPHHDAVEGVGHRDWAPR